MERTDVTQNWRLNHIAEMHPRVLLAKRGERLLCWLLLKPAREIYKMLKDFNGCYVNEIEEALDMPQPIVSRHLAHMREIRIVETERRGRFIWYRINEKREREIIEITKQLAG